MLSLPMRLRAPAFLDLRHLAFAAALTMSVPGCVSGAAAPLPAAPDPPPLGDPTTWIVSGQSNALGYASGPSPGVIPHAQMWNIRTRRWEPLSDPPAFGVEPLYIVENRVSAWPTAARAVLASGAVKDLRIGGWAEGGLSIDQWSERGHAWRGLREAIVAARRVDVFIWFQGESDADVKHYRGAPRYAARLRYLLARVRALARNPQLRVVICSIGPADPKYLNLRSLRTIFEAQRVVADDEPLGTFIDTRALPRNGEHLTADGYMRLGETIARALTR